MATNIGTLLVTVTSSSAPLVSGLNLAAVAVGAFVGASVKAAADFDKSFTRIAAISNTSASAIAGMRDSVLELSGSTAVAPTELADALFFLASAGLDASQVMPALEMSAKAAAVGLGDTADVANIVASALNAYSKTGLTAAAATDVLVAAVREGRAEPEEFATALGRILPIASTAGVTFDEVAASLAGLSNIGLDVNEGVTAMRGLLQAIAAPGKMAAESLDSIGLSAQELLNAISDQGLLGALRLLDAAAKANTSGQAEYINVLRQVVPNIRSLTGQLGLMSQDADKVAGIFDRVTHSTGALGDAFDTTSQSPSFRLRQALNDIRVVLVEFGSTILPDVAAALRPVGAALRFVTQFATALFSAFIAYTALTFLPRLLLSISTQIAAMGAVNAATSLKSLAVSLTLTASEAVLAAGAIALVVYGLNEIAKSSARLTADLTAGTTAAVRAFADESYKTDAATIQFAAHLIQLKNEAAGLGVDINVTQVAIAELRNAYVSGDIAQGDFAKGLAAAGVSAKTADRIIRETTNGVDEWTFHINKAGQRVQNFAGMTNAALDDFNQAVGESMQVAIGQFESLGDAFDTTPDELRRQLRTAITIARRFKSDLEAIVSDKSLSEKQKAALAALPANQRAAFVKATDAGKEELARGATTLARLNAAAMKGVGNAGKGPGKRGGEETGRAIMDGVADGITLNKGAAIAAGVTSVQEIIARMERAAAIASPSKKTMRIGRELDNGLIRGIEQGLPGLDRAVDALMERIDAVEKGLSDAAKGALTDQLRAFGREINEVSRRFERLVSRVNDFKDAIRSGFEQFDLVGGAIDLLNTFNEEMARFVEAQTAGTLEPGQVAPTAPDLAAFAADQVAAAQHLADVLTGLSEAGLNKTLLGQLAGQGPAGAQFGEALLNDPSLIAAFNNAQSEIAAALGSTTTTLIAEQFGKQLEHARADFERLSDNLQRFIRRLDGDVIPGLDRFVHRIDELIDNLPNGGGNGANAQREANDDTRTGRVVDAIREPKRVEMVIRPGSEQALRFLIQQVVAEMNLQRAPL